MAYEKLNLVKGQVLEAEHMAHIEDGISKAAVAYEETGMVEVLAETTVTGEVGYEWTIAEVINVEVGKTYTVVLNGVEYKCVAQECPMDEGITAVALGNMSAVGGNDTGEPFLSLHFSADVAAMLGAGGMIYVFNESVSATLAIYGEGTVIHPIDPKYIVLTSPNGTKFNLSVSDDGTLTSTAI